MHEYDKYLIASELVPSSKALAGVGVTLGDADITDVSMGRISLRIGRRPLAIPLIPLAKLKGQKIGDEFHLLLRAYEPWLMLYSVGIQDTGDWRNVARFGLKVELVDQPTAGVASVFPESTCLQIGNGNVKWNGGIGISGSVSATVGEDSITGGVAGTLLGPLASLGVKAGLSSKADVTLQMSFNVMTPLITTSGANDETTQWTFVRGTSEIFGGDQTVGHILLLPKPAIGSLKVKATLFADIGLLWVFTRRVQSREPAIINIRLD